MVKIRTTKTRHKGVLAVVDRPNTFRLRGTVTNAKTGKNVDLDKVVTAKSPLDASRKRAELLEEMQKALPSTERRRLEDFARWWLASKLPELKASTRSLYAMVLDEHIIPELGDYYLDAITREDLIDWRNRTAAKPVKTPQGEAKRGPDGSPVLPTPTTVNGRFRILKTLLKEAVDAHHMERDPTRRIKSLDEGPEPTGDEDEAEEEDQGKSITADQLRALLNQARTSKPRWFPFFYVLAFTGMRFGEATALKWSDIDEAEGKIWIRRAQYKGHIGKVKNKKVRTVPLTPELLAVLKDHQRAERQRLTKRLKRQRVPNIDPEQAGGPWVFPSRKPGTLMHNTAPRKALHACMAGAGIDTFTIHGFRHTFNNLVRQAAGLAGQNVVLQAMTGHSSDEMTEHYSQVSIEEKRVAVGGLLKLVALDS